MGGERAVGGERAMGVERAVGRERALGREHDFGRERAVGGKRSGDRILVDNFTRERQDPPALYVNRTSAATRHTSAHMLRRQRSWVRLQLFW